MTDDFGAHALLVGLQYIDKKWSCQPDLADAQNTDYLVN